MGNSSERLGDGYSLRFFSPQQLDEILRSGSKQGRNGSHAAIERILRLEPEVQRTELWKRIRELKFSERQRHRIRSSWSAEDDRVLREGYAAGWQGKRNSIRQLLRRHSDWRPYVIWQRAKRTGLVQTLARRGQERSGLKWTEEDHRLLMDLAGYKSVRMIAKMLHRSEAAIRYHLTTLGESSRVHRGGYARAALARDLHFSTRIIRRFIAEGLLEVRDPRITRESLDRLKSSKHLAAIQESEGFAPTGCPMRDATLGTRRSMFLLATAEPRCPADSSNKISRAKRVWSEVAVSLGMSTKAVESLIVRGVLKLYEPTITEISLRQFCRGYGSFIQREYLSRETREWLTNSMDWVPTAGETMSQRLASLRKHARIVRRCSNCGRSVRGNAFFRHAFKCRPERARINTRGLHEHRVP